MKKREVLKEMFNDDLTLQYKEKLIEQYAKQEKIKLLEKLQGVAGIQSDQIIYRELKTLKDG